MNGEPTIIGSVIVMAMAYCTIAGACWTLWAIFAEWGPFAKFWRERRNVNVVRDDIVRGVIRGLVEDRSNWTAAKKGDQGYHKFEVIQRADGDVIIHNYDTPNAIWIEMRDLGHFHATDLRPSMAKGLSEACNAFKDYRALIAIHQQ